MEEKWNKILKILKEEKQEQILQIKINNKEEFANEILNINFDQLNKLYKKSIENKKIISQNIEPISYVDKEKLSKEEYEKYREIGEKIIKNNQYAVITMAGGQGTRLGHNGPKGTYDFGLESHKTIFEILCDSLKNSYKKYGVYVPWYIMTSKQNNNQTIEFFEKNNYFDYPKENIYFFEQGELPVLDEQGKLLINKDGNLNQAADGHGGIFVAMRKNGYEKKKYQLGIYWTSR